MAGPLSLLCHPNVAARSAGMTLGEFVDANELVHVRLSDTPRHHIWRQFARHANLPVTTVERGLVFDTALLAVQYALSGDGLVLVDTMLVEEEVNDGRLVKPFDVDVDDGYGYYLITHPEGLSDTAIALFRSWLIQRFGSAAQADRTPSKLHLAVSNP